jgi:Rieske Fe-S protein
MEGDADDHGDVGADVSALCDHVGCIPLELIEFGSRGVDQSEDRGRVGVECINE